MFLQFLRKTPTTSTLFFRSAPLHFNTWKKVYGDKTFYKLKIWPLNGVKSLIPLTLSAFLRAVENNKKKLKKNLFFYAQISPCKRWQRNLTPFGSYGENKKKKQRKATFNFYELSTMRQHELAKMFEFLNSQPVLNCSFNKVISRLRWSDGVLYSLERICVLYTKVPNESMSQYIYTYSLGYQWGSAEHHRIELARSFAIDYDLRHTNKNWHQEICSKQLLSQIKK